MTLTNQYELNNLIDHDKDYTYDYFGYKTLERSYLLKINGNVVERDRSQMGWCIWRMKAIR